MIFKFFEMNLYMVISINVKMYKFHSPSLYLTVSQLDKLYFTFMFLFFISIPKD